MQNTLEEMALTQHSNEQEQQPEPPETTASSEPEEAKPETQEQEVTALIPAEPEVIEGEFVEIEPQETTEDHRPPKQKPYWLLIPFTILFCLVFVARTAAIQVHGRELLPLTLMQSMSAPATEKRHQDATRAKGTITFYNSLLSHQTIPAGTIVTGNDGVQIITDQAARIPAGNPPSYGQVTVSAHAVVAGPKGNVPAYDINTACCATSVVAKNTESFTGGAAAREYLVVTRADINTAVTSLLLTLSESEVAALQAQLHPGEALITPSCNPSVSSNHHPGDEAKQITITVSETCTGFAYVAQQVYADALQLLTAQATTTLGAEYALLGDIQITIVHATARDPRQGSVNMDVQVTGTWVYQITPAIQQRLSRLIAGKTNQQAGALLLQFPGIAGAQITLKGRNQTLPQDPRGIHLIVVHRSAAE